MSLGSVISGLIGSGQKLPTVDISALLNTINGNGAYQKSLINGLPAQIQQLLADYAKQNSAAGATYQNNITNQGNDYMAKAASIYGPNSQAAQDQMNAARTQIYSTVPGTQDAIRNAMAATGGLARGNAGVALANPYIAAAQQYGQTASNIAGRQGELQQNAQADALKVVNTMNDTMFQNLFGMSKQQAQTILTTGNTALSNQLSQLLTQSNNQTAQTLAAQGIAVNNGYQNAVTRNAQQNGIWNGLADMGLQGIQAGMGAMGGMGGMMGAASGATTAGGIPTISGLGDADLASMAETAF